MRIDYATIAGSQDPVMEIHRVAVYELRAAHNYGEDEIALVEQDEVLRDSCRRAFLSMRNEAWRKREAGGPTARAVRLAYTRPETRTYFDREARRE